MEKDAFYFPHFYNARQDRKIKRVRKELGVEGYGIFFMILEVLREQTDYRFPLEDIDLLADDFGTSVQKVQAVISNYGLFHFDSKETFFSSSLIMFLQPYFEGKEKKRISGIKGNLLRYKHIEKEVLEGMSDKDIEEVAEGITGFSHSERKAIPNLSQMLANEKKLKESKEKKLKESNEIRESREIDIRGSIETVVSVSNKTESYISDAHLLRYWKDSLLQKEPLSTWSDISKENEQLSILTNKTINIFEQTPYYTTKEKLVDEIINLFLEMRDSGIVQGIIGCPTIPSHISQFWTEIITTMTDRFHIEAEIHQADALVAEV
ncbi:MULTISPECIES: DUF4373 domain-containing protein [unclassified Oceanispirochaeta]|uniref:DUF4373 domain-containing protein n=1 Tax=unclassified Oceanispirochaeta TaxID=2635722 RepID=UPI000E09DB27|nr:MULTISPECIES: DUF4373 domain-containing protein [unclassified Oceanispirochaeta]MBF9018890.1 DUF4373 domain-containing protein [Oceanispirochaeta sp. M2]NPD75389.1 DUF4373 domain-containing protein [Oceanispirochaeta sp. M1]RDG28752.1 DUF4373 domain-containing protein [Oceanispirochaeta sp. M1]